VGVGGRGAGFLWSAEDLLIINKYFIIKSKFKRYFARHI
jgi:hypothetical protein